MLERIIELDKIISESKNEKAKLIKKIANDDTQPILDRLSVWLSYGNAKTASDLFDLKCSCPKTREALDRYEVDRHRKINLVEWLCEESSFFLTDIYKVENLEDGDMEEWKDYEIPTDKLEILTELMNANINSVIYDW